MAPAKLNLGLHVLRRRTDGFHDIETVMLAVGWADVVRARTADAWRFVCSDPALPGGEGNLCVRAARALAAWAGTEPRGELALEKRLPHGAGLGGGSSDAAATLRALAGLWGLDVPAEALRALAAGLGSDVPFFLGPRAALATGRGEVLTPLEGYRCPFWFAVVMPPVTVGTAGAYALVAPDDRRRPDLAAAVRSNDLDRWRRELSNDFEAPITAREPAIAAERHRLWAAGAGYAAMTGSGAAVFGVFEGEADARAAAEEARARGRAAWAGQAV